MRLLKLEVENLNALYGPHCIDFVADLQEAPLFLISGPTGAGKSTLLDAISLALFGVTPRLREDGPREAKQDVSPLQALSRGTAKARAVLTFRKSSPGTDPTTYRATWETWRGNRRNPKTEGTPQGPYRWLERLEDGNWTPMATDYPGEQGRAKDLYAALTEALEGFSLQDFTRCMLLAQGDFAAFLRASEAERGAILERLTRTEQYQQLGARAAQRLREAKATEEQAAQAVGNLQVMDARELEALEQELTQREAEARSAQEQSTLIQTSLAWIDQAERLAGDLTKAREALEAARQAEREAAPEQDRLRAFEEVWEALAHLKTTQAKRTQVRELAGEQANRLQAAQELTATLETIQAEGKQAADQLQASQTDLDTQEPLLQEARRLRLALRGAELEAATALERAQEAKQTLEKAQQTLATAQEQHQQQEAANAQAEAHLAEAPWGALVEAMGALETRHQNLEDHGKRLTKERDALARFTRELPILELLQDESSTFLQAQLMRMETLQGEESACHRELDSALAGFPDPTEARRHLDREREALLLRQSALEALNRLFPGLEQASARVRELQTRAEAAKQAAEAAIAQAQAATTEQEASSRSLRDLETQLDLLRWTRDLALERDRLQAGCPCPLCGAEAHPALEDAAQGTKDQELRETCARLKAQLVAARARLAQDEATASTARDRAIRLGTQAEADGDLLSGAQTQATDARQTLAREAEALALEAQPATVEQSLQAGASARQALDQRRRLLDDRENAHRKASQELSQAQQEAQRLEGLHRQAEERLRERKARLEEETRRITLAADELAEQSRALQAELASHGVDPEGGMAEARRRAERHVQAREEAKAAGRKLDAATHEQELAQQTHQGATQAMTDRRSEASARESTLAEARAEVAACLGGADPEPIHARLKTDRDRAKQRHEDLRQRYQDARIEQTRAQKSWEETDALLGRAREALAEAEALLTDFLCPIGDEAALEARALSPEAFQTLIQQRSRLEETLKASATTLKTLEEQQAKHDGQRHPGGLDRTVLEATLQESREAQRRASEATGSLRTRLATQEEARQRQAEGLEVLRKAQAELSLWTRMGKLIGTNEGEAFRKFAQVLNLRDLLTKANARLEKLRPRYRLVPATDGEGAERLAFAVEDGAHAGEVRPVGTLSGGETFLVSLSLALALADYRTVRMPIETLLLDEGFGTLDPRTLADVLGTLGTLTSQGTQVGLISHVEMMAEKIPARIRVEPVAPGRSRVRVERDGV